MYQIKNTTYVQNGEKCKWSFDLILANKIIWPVGRFVWQDRDSGALLDLSFSAGTKKAFKKYV